MKEIVSKSIAHLSSAQSLMLVILTNRSGRNPGLPRPHLPTRFRPEGVCRLPPPSGPASQSPRLPLSLGPAPPRPPWSPSPAPSSSHPRWPLRPRPRPSAPARVRSPETPARLPRRGRDRGCQLLQPLFIPAGRPPAPALGAVVRRLFLQGAPGGAHAASRGRTQSPATPEGSLRAPHPESGACASRGLT